MKFHFSRANFLALSLTSVVATAPVIAQSAATKPTFTSKKYGFSIYLPQTPQTDKKELPEQIGGGTTDIYFTPPLTDAPVFYSILPIILPAAATKLPQKSYFDGVQVGVLGSSKGKSLGSRDVKVNGITARDFLWSFSSPTPDSKTLVKFSGQTRIYKIGRRTFQFTALVKSADLAKNKAQIAKVLGSIVIK